MDRDELMFNEYKLYSEQKENFIDRNFKTNKFYMAAIFIVILAMIYTSNVVFLSRISATLVFAILGLAFTSLWWMNVDSYNTLIKVKYANVIEKMEEALPFKPFTEEYKGIQDFRDNKVFMFSDIQKLVAVVVALFFFAVCVGEATPLIFTIIKKLAALISHTECGI